MFRFPRTRRSRAAGGRSWLTPTSPGGGGGGGGPSITLPFIDDFNRADGAPGNGWVDAGSAASNCPTTIQTNVIRPSVAGKGNTLIRDLGVSLGYEVSAAFTGPDTYHVIMISSLLDQSHYIYAAVTNGASYVDVDGVDHVIGGAGVGAGVMRVVVGATGLVTVYFSDALIGSYQLTAGDLAHLGTYSGVGTYNQVIDTFAAQVYDSANLLLNPSFELDFNSDGLADSWSNYAGTMTIVPTVGGGQHGTKSQRLTPGVGDYCLIHQMVPALGGHEYTLTTCFRIAAQNGGSVECKIEWYAADGTSLVDYNYDPNLTPVGYHTDVLVHTAPAGASFAQVVVTTGGGCVTDIDFMSLVDTTLFHDEFSRADGALGAPWVNIAPTVYSPHAPTDVVVASGAAAVPGGADTISLAYVDVGISNGAVGAVSSALGTVPGDSAAGVAFRIQDSTHFYTAVQITTGELVVYKFAGGSVTVPARTGLSSAPGLLRVTMSGDNITVTAPTGSVTFTDSDYNTATKHGLYLIHPTLAAFDSFFIASAP